MKAITLFMIGMTVINAVHLRDTVQVADEFEDDNLL